MNWIISSLIMFTSSVILYLFVRRSSLDKHSSQYNNLAMFLPPLLIYFPLGLAAGQNFNLNLIQFVSIVFISIFLSYAGNIFSLKSIEFAPNPGYSLVISKSYVVFTTAVSVLFLNAELSFRKAAAIFIIVIFSYFIMLSHKPLEKRVNMVWIPLAIGAFFCWGLLSLFSKHLFNDGVSVVVFLTYMNLIVSYCIVVEMFRKKLSYEIIRKNPWDFIFIGIFSTAFNLFLFQAVKDAPNIGYVNAINASSISAITLMAILIFKDEFSKRKLLGIAGVTFGLLLLIL